MGIQHEIYYAERQVQPIRTRSGPEMSFQPDGRLMKSYGAEAVLLTSNIVALEGRQRMWRLLVTCATMIIISVIAVAVLWHFGDLTRKAGGSVEFRGVLKLQIPFPETQVRPGGGAQGLCFPPCSVAPFSAWSP